MDRKERLLSLVLDGGATKAAVITQGDIKVHADFRKTCEMNQCGAYDKNWTCPPCIGPIEELMDKVRAYPFGVLYQTIADIEDSFDIEGMNEAAGYHAKLSQSINEELFTGLAGDDYLHLAAGGCKICKPCAKVTDEPCRFPEKALSSMEGYGIDVYNTTKGTGLKYINGQNTVTYFGLILFRE